MLYFLLGVSGLVGGFLAGLIGIGGGLVYVMVLSELFVLMGYSGTELTQLTIANSFSAILFASGRSLLSHIQKKEFYPKQILLVSVGAVLSGLITQVYFVNTSQYNYKSFSIVLLGLMFFILVRNLTTKESIKEKIESDISPIIYLLTGIITGVVAAISGMGGGIIIMPVLFGLFRLNYHITKSISLGAIFLIAAFTTVMNIVNPPLATNYPFVGLIHLGYVVILAGSVLIAAPLGVKMARKLSSKKIKVIYACFLILFIVRKLIDIL